MYSLLSFISPLPKFMYLATFFYSLIPIYIPHITSKSKNYSWKEGKLLFNGYRGSVCDDEKVLEIVNDDGHSTLSM